MKNTKKLISLLLALVMVFSLAATAFAAEGDTSGVAEEPDPAVSAVVTYEDYIDPKHNSNITIEVLNAGLDTTYNIYKVLDVVHYDPTEPSIRYKVHTADMKDHKGNTSYHNWTNFFDAVIPNTTTPIIWDVFFKSDSNGYVTEVPNADMATFGEYALNYVLGYDFEKGENPENWIRRIEPLQSVHGVTDERVTTEGLGVATFTGLEAGYYLITSTAGSLKTIISVVNETGATPFTRTVTGKNSIPAVVKEVYEDSTGTWGSSNDEEVGTPVDFRAFITTQTGAINYTYKDVMSEGLTMDYKSIKVYYSNEILVDKGYDELTWTELEIITTNDESEYVSGAWTYTSQANLDCDCTFHVSFANEWLETITANHVIKIEYQATINEKAYVVGEDGTVTGIDLTNKGALRYGHEGKSETEWDHTQTYVWDFNVHKFDAETGAALKDAEFALYRKTSETTWEYAKFDTVAAADGSVAAYRFNSWTSVAAEAGVPALAEGETGTYTLISNANGNFNILGLDEGTYYLRETKAPDNYNLPDNDIAVYVVSTEGAMDENGVVTLSATVSIDGANDEKVELGDKTVRISNQKGPKLPETGGIGTTLFYVFGGTMMVGALILLVTKRRMSV